MKRITTISKVNNHSKAIPFLRSNIGFFLSMIVMMVYSQLAVAQTQTFTTTGAGQSFTVPAGVTSITVQAWGSGAGGYNGRGGGGGGAFAGNTALAVTPGTTYTVTVGAGAATASGGNGAASSFSTLVIAAGGSASTATNTAGIGGTTAASTGVIKFAGGNGGASNAFTSGAGGGGSAGAGGNGGNGVSPTSSAVGGVAGTAGAAGSLSGGAAGGTGGTSNGNANDGNDPGAGGGERGDNGTNSGGGGDGKVIVSWTCPTYSLTSTTTNSPITVGATATVTLTSGATNLPVGNYTVTYDLSGANASTNNTVAMTVAVAGTGSFATGALSDDGTTTVTITNLASGSGTGTGTLNCNYAISSNNTAAIDVVPAVTYTTTGVSSFTPPLGVSSVTVQAWGAGGGGSSRTSTGQGGGGGGGAYASSSVSVTGGTAYSLTVGAGGAPANNGGNSSFNTSSVVAEGGKGVANNTITGGAGGLNTNSTGSTKYSGGTGGTASGTSGGGGGGAGSTGPGGLASGGTAGAATSINGGAGGAGGATGNAIGAAGSIYGGGGSGSSRTSGTQNGGTGAQGLVIVKWTCPVYSIATGISATTPATTGVTSTVTVTSTSGLLANGTYTVTYDLSGANTSANQTSSMTVTSGVGTFTTIAIANVGATTITLTDISNGISPSICANTVTANNTTVISINSATFNTAGTSSFTVPAGITCVKVDAIGGGAGGSTRSTNSGSAAGGGGGAFASGSVAVTSGSSYTVVVGAGGAASTSGTDSTFNSTSVVAEGGFTSGSDSTTAGPGGTTAGSTGNIVTYKGGNGGAGSATGNSSSGAGGGGAGTTGAGGNATTSTAGTGTTVGGGNGASGVTTGNNGTIGNTYGGGGSGGAANSNTNRTGGAGASGLVTITWVDASNFSTSATAAVCPNNPATVTVTSTTLADGAYTVTYNTTNPTSTGSTATMTFSGVTGTFSTMNLTNATGSAVTANITITNIRFTSWTCGTTVSTGNTASVTVNPTLTASVSIAASPSGAVCSGTNVTFTATPTNGGTPTYQWKLNGANVGINSATYSNSGLTNGNTVSVVMTSTASPCLAGSPATSNTVTMTVNPILTASVSIVASPSGAVCSGTNVTFTATPTNGGTPTYQWKLNGGNVGTNSATYSNSLLANSDIVTVVMTSTASPCLAGSPATSNAVTMTVNPILTASVSIAAFPSGAVCSGTNVTFTATPTNGGTPTYQWKLNGGNVGTNSVNYSNSSLANSDIVTVVMTSTASPCLAGSPATSNAVTMTVNPILTASVSIAASPSGAVCSGTNVTFTATPTNGGTPTYQWKLNGGNVGTNSATYSNSLLANSDIVTVVMTSTASPCLAGSPATSNAVTMTVNPNLAASVSIGASPSSTICSGTNVTFTATPTNGGTPTYQWKLNGGNVGTNSTTYSNSLLANSDVVTVVMTSTATCATGSPATSNAVTMTVNTLSVAPTGITGTTAICSGSSTTLTLSGGSAGTGAIAQWYAVSCGGVPGDTGLSITVSPSSTTTYYVQYTGTCNTTTCASTTVTIGTPITSSDGVIWTGGSPSANVDAVLTGGGTIVLSADLTACSLTVNGPNVTVASGKNVDLYGPIKVTSGSFALSNNANLIQHNSNYTNTGSIAVHRNSASIKRLDYTLWSTPVTGQELYAFSPLTFANRYYTYNSGTDQYNAFGGFAISGQDGNGVNGTDGNHAQFSVGTGYLIRAPWNHPTAPAMFAGTFTGVPNNGNVVIGTTNGLYYAIGNPYPSTIDADEFILNNSIGDDVNTLGDGLYFWRKTNNSTAASYATYTTAGGVASGGDTSLVPIVPNGVIQVGEGFIVKATSGTLAFNNDQRIGDNNDQFLRSTATIERNRIWLNLSNGTAKINQMMVSYMTGATQNIDPAIDGRYFNDNPTALNSLINNEEFAIQGRSLPFNSSDIVPLAFKATTAGNYSIAIDHVDGLFTGGAQSIYLKDNLLNTYHDFAGGAYDFASTTGTFNSRFEIVFQSQLANPVFTANTVVIYNQNNGFAVNSGNTIMSSIKVFDIRGRLIEEKKGINASQTTITGGSANEVLLVQITSEDGVVVTKKVIK